MGAWERNVQRKTSLGVQNLGQERVITEEEKKRVHSVKCCRKSGFKGRGAECGPSALGAKDGLPEGSSHKWWEEAWLCRVEEWEEEWGQAPIPEKHSDGWIGSQRKSWFHFFCFLSFGFRKARHEWVWWEGTRREKIIGDERDQNSQVFGKMGIPFKPPQGGLRFNSRDNYPDLAQCRPQELKVMMRLIGYKFISSHDPSGWIMHEKDSQNLGNCYY